MGAIKLAAADRRLEKDRENTKRRYRVKPDIR